MFQANSSTVQRLARYRPFVSLLLPLCLAPLASCAEDTYLAQNYQTNPPAYVQPTYSTQPPAYAAPAATGSQFLAPPQLAELVNRIALYPDDLIGIILPASTYPLQIVQAARYLDAVRSNSTLAPDDSWDNSVVALLNYPNVVNMMDRELEWTERLGQAVVMQQADVISAIGEFRAQVQSAGNLRSDDRQVIENEQGVIRIRPANPQVIYVPQYEPSRVIVYQSEPAYSYYPRPYPVYYYNYASGYPTGFNNFWGVSTMFTIGWSNRSVHLHDYDYYDDPRFDRPYNGNFYRRSHHGWRDNDDHRGRDHDGRDNDGRDGHDGRDNHDGRDGIGHSKPPPERDWQPRGGRGPRQIGVGNGGRGRDQGDQSGGGDHGGGGAQAGRDPGRGGPRVDGGQSGGNFVPTPIPRRMQPRDAEINERRTVRPMTSGAGGNSSADPGRVPRTPRIIEAPSTPDAMNTRRGGGMSTAPRAFESQPDNPPARFSAPTPRRLERDTNVPRYAPVGPSPTRSLRDADAARSNARVSPSRPEPRIVTPRRAEPRNAPSRQEMRVAPSRPEPRVSAPSSRNSDGPANVRRPSDDDRGRGNRDRDR